MRILLLIHLWTVGLCLEEAEDDGGWATEKHLLLAHPGPCSIEVREADSLSQKEFLEKYAFTQPVVIRHATDNTKFQDACRKDYMLSEHGTKKIRLSSANTYSYNKVDVSLHKYVHDIMKPQTLDMLGNETFYWFGDNNHTEWETLFSLYKPPPYRLPKMSAVYSFGLAGAGTGVPFHFHGPGFGEVVFGRKRWFMYPPDETPDFHPNRTTLHWLIEDYPLLDHMNKPLECTISKGELIYFPTVGGTGPSTSTPVSSSPPSLPKRRRETLSTTAASVSRESQTFYRFTSFINAECYL